MSQCEFCEDELEGRTKIEHARWGCPVAYKVLTKSVAPLCACGCKEKVQLSKRNPKLFNKYIRGHNKRQIHAKISS